MSDDELEYLIKDYDLPLQRKSGFNKSNILWLYNNIAKFNSDKPKFDLVFKTIEHRIINKIYNN